MVSEPAPCPKRFASVGQARTIIVESHIVAMEDTVTSDGQIACLCLSEPRFRGVPCRDSREWVTCPHRDGACWLIDPPPSLRAFPAHSTCHHNIRKGLRPQAHVNGRNGGEALTPCVANASQTNPHTKSAALFGAQLKAQEAAPASGVVGGQGHAKSTTFCYKSTRTPKIFAPAAGCGRLRRGVLSLSAGPLRPSWRQFAVG